MKPPISRIEVRETTHPAVARVNFAKRTVFAGFHSCLFVSIRGCNNSFPLGRFGFRLQVPEGFSIARPEPQRLAEMSGRFRAPAQASQGDTEIAVRFWIFSI